MATNNITALAAKNHPTKALIESGKPLVLTCGINKGLKLSVNQDGSKTWTYRYRNSAGKIRQIKLGTYSNACGLKEAKKLYDEVKLQRDKGNDPAQNLIDERAALKRQNNAESYTVQNMMNDYLIGHIEKKRKTEGATIVSNWIDKYINPAIGKKPAIKLNRLILVELLSTLTKTTAPQVKNEIKAAFEFAVTNGNLPDDIVNPANRIKLEYKKPIGRAFNLKEVSALIQWLPESSMSQNVRDVLMLCLFTGCRSGEIVAAKWSDVDLDNKTLTLNETKTGIPRNVQLSNQAVELLKTREQGEWLFTGHRKHITQSAIVSALCAKSKSSKRVKHSAGLGDWSAHDIRRTVRTQLAEMGCPHAVAEAVLGHSKQGIHGVYDLSLRAKECRVWLQRWCDKIYPLYSNDKVVRGVFNG